MLIRAGTNDKSLFSLIISKRQRETIS